jgi:enoyl-CoA hydratase/carnithine racemase
MEAFATVRIGPGPLANVRVGAGACLREDLERLTIEPPRAVLLVGEGDLGTDDTRPSTPAGLRDPAALLAALPAPTVAVWTGDASGGAAEVLLAADIRVCGTAATMAFPEVGRGELPCWGGTQRLPRVVGPALALRMLLLGDPADAATFARAGGAAVAPDPLGTARELAARLAEGAPRALAAARDAVLRGLDLTLAEGLRLESDLNLLLSTTDDRAEGIAAFFEKRPPRFTGR